MSGKQSNSNKGKKKTDIQEERRKFTDMMDKIWTHGATVGPIDSKMWMEGMDAAFKIVVADEFPFAYEYVVNILRVGAPTMNKTKYMELGQSMYRVCSYMQRFEIPHARLPSLMDVAKDFSEICVDSENTLKEDPQSVRIDR